MNPRLLLLPLIVASCSSADRELRPRLDASAGAGGGAGLAGTTGIGGSAGMGAFGGDSGSGLGGSGAGSGASTGGGGAATGGMGGTGASSGGTSGVGGTGTGGAAGGTCAGALAAALPSTILLEQFTSLEQTRSGPACASCKYNPCGYCEATWDTPAVAGPTAYVTVTFSCSLQGKYGACGSEINCPLGLGASGTVTVQFAGGTIQSAGFALTGSVGTGCPYAKAEDAASALATAGKDAITGLVVSGC